MNTIESARLSAIDIVQWTPVELSVVCPNVDADQLEVVLGFDLRDLATIVSEEFPVINEAVKQNTTTVQTLLSRIDTSLTDFEAYIDKAEDFMWIVPGLLFAVSMLAAITMLGVLLAWKEKSGRCFQRTMSYITLPLLLIVTLMCWALVISSSFGAMITYGKKSDLTCLSVHTCYHSFLKMKRILFPFPCQQMHVPRESHLDHPTIPSIKLFRHIVLTATTLSTSL